MTGHLPPGTPYRREWRNAGCGLTFVFFLAGAFCLAAPVTAIFTKLFGSEHLPWTSLLSLILVTVGLRWAYKRLTMRTVPICPHCGVATSLQFRICASCGRVKD